MLRKGLILVGLTISAACSGEPNSPSEGPGFSDQAIRSIASDLAVQKGMNLLCDRVSEDELGSFMEDLRYEGIDRDVRESIMSDSVEMMNKISAEEPEYICTPEMFESADLRVSQSLLTWDEMRGITQ